MEKNASLRSLQIIAFLAALAGAIISLIFTLHAGQKNKSVFLPLLFVIWVESPYVALIFANAKFRNYPTKRRIVLYVWMILLSIASLIGYSGILSPADAKPAAVFLIVPLISWVAFGIVILISKKFK